jgi:hypothetical protein
VTDTDAGVVTPDGTARRPRKYPIAKLTNTAVIIAAAISTFLLFK